ncbi:hypothetical protein [Arthrobacter sp. NEB 688]|uniref:hypothetical protein n=1 Tax=Arthrobacter sp. NEB 688 TaxID=904039 RepID=UPI0015638078|nr:hypothetical protein [Arthrobacter sp. NEB 688]QKE85634.1 hypothetical protein HL663_18035 [Arthrobacter sp. NEB 688]
MFQLLFLQGGLTALLSASAYARGAHLAASGAHTGSVVRPFVTFVLLGAIGAWVLGTVLVDGPGAHGSWVIAALSLGSAGASLSGLLQGIIVVRRGGAAAFAPVVVLTTIAIAAMGLAWGQDSPLALTLLWVAPQVLGPVLLVRVLRRLDSTGGSASVGPGTKDESQFARVGVLNASSVAVAYQFREVWAAGQGDGAASGSFGVLRVTELAYQVAYMALASQPRRLTGLVTRRLRSRTARGLFVVVGLAAAGLGTLPALTTDSWSLTGFVIAEAAVMPARLLTMACYLSLLGRPTTRAYQGVMLTTVLLSALSIASPAMTGSAYGLQLLQCVAAAVGVIGIALVRAPHGPTYDRSL